MDLKAATQMAVEILDQHRLFEKGWSFEWSQARRNFGFCYLHSKRIKLSRPLTLLNEPEQVRDTILHEVAHALAGFGQGHGPKWKEIARQIGARPERCYETEDLTMPAAPFEAVCRACQKPSHRFRPPPEGRRYSCRHCSGGKFDPNFVLEWKRNNS